MVEQSHRLFGRTLPMNRRDFAAHLAIETAQIDHFGGQLGLIFFSLDDLRGLYRSVGRRGGDAFLDHLSAHLVCRIRAEDLFARRSGNEFAVLSPGTDLSETTGFAIKVRRLVEEFRLNATGVVSASLGVTGYQRGEGVDALEARAEGAMQRARASGGNRINAVRAVLTLQ